MNFYLKTQQTFELNFKLIDIKRIKNIKKQRFKSLACSSKFNYKKAFLFAQKSSLEKLIEKSFIKKSKKKL